MVDIPTLLFASCTARIGFILIFLIASFRSEARGAFQLWTVSILCSMIGMLLMYSDPDYPHFQPTRGTLIYTIFGLSLSTVWAGGCAFFRRAASKVRFVVIAFMPGVVYAGTSALGLLPDTVVTLTIVMFVGSSAAAAATFLIRSDRRYLPSQLLVGLALAAYSATLVISIILMVIRFLKPGIIPGPQTSDVSFALVIDQLMSVLIYVGLVAMSLEDVQLRMKKLATTDLLTGLANRLGVHDRTVPLIGASFRAKRPMAVLIADIDHFKLINDRYGHTSGDLVLREFARRLTSHSRRTQDVTGRWGGEEFLAVYCDMTLEEAVRFAELLCRRVSDEEFDIGHQKITVTVSIGVAEILNHATPLEQAVRVADEALYEAKRKGRNRVQGAMTVAAA